MWEFYLVSAELSELSWPASFWAGLFRLSRDESPRVGNPHGSQLCL